MADRTEPAVPRTRPGPRGPSVAAAPRPPLVRELLLVAALSLACRTGRLLAVALAVVPPPLRGSARPCGARAARRAPADGPVPAGAGAGR